MATPIGPLVTFGGALLVLSALSLVRARPPDLTRVRWFAAAMASLGLSMLMLAAPEVVSVARPFVIARSALFIASALLLVAFRHSFIPFRRPWWIAAAAIEALALLATLAFPPSPTEGPEVTFSISQLTSIGIWGVVVLAVAISFWRLGTGRSPAQRSRIRTLAIGIAALAGLVGGTGAARGLSGDLTPPWVVQTLAVVSLAVLTAGISPPRWLRQLQGGADRERMRADITRRIALATNREELGRAAVHGATQLTGAEAAFLIDRDHVVTSDGLPGVVAERLHSWSDGEVVERTVRIDDRDPVLVILRKTAQGGTLGVVSGPFSPVFGSDEGAQLEELATTVGLALTRVQLFDDLHRQTQRSEQLLDAISDLGEGVFISDGSRLLEVNDALGRMLGMTRSELLRMPSLVDLARTEDRTLAQEFQRSLLGRLHGGRIADRFEATLVRPDGRTLDVAIAVRALDTSAGRRLIGAVRDVTATRRALRHQQRRAQHLAAIRQLESTVAGLLEVGPLVDAISEATAELLRCEVVAIVLLGPDGETSSAGRGLDDGDMRSLVTALEDEQTKSSLRGLRNLDLDRLGLPPDHGLGPGTSAVVVPGGDRHATVVVLANRAGREPLDDIDREALRDLASYVAEVTQTVRAYELERSTADELRRIDETRDLLLSAVSHDLRSPLSAIATMARTLELRGEALDADFRLEMSRRIHAQAIRLGKVVTDLLDLDRLRRGMLVAERRPVALEAVVHGSLGGVDRRALERVTTEVDDVVVLIDAPKVERLIENLIVNAMRYSPEDARVWVKAHDIGGRVRIAVEDEGPGVPEAERERIFEAFERGGTSGFGLGLALVRRIAELHGGRAWAEERPGGGARFVVELRHEQPDTIIDVTAPAASEQDPIEAPVEQDPDAPPRGRRRPGPG